jgi:hypothetical protein
MKKNVMLVLSLLFLNSLHISAKLNEFGISDIIPSHSDDNKTFDQRISEEIANGQKIKFKGRRTDSFTIDDILKFIPNIQNYFEFYLNHPDSKDPQALELIKLAIIDVEKAKKMLRAKNVTPEQEHQLRFIFDPIKTKINGYDHTDNIEASSYIVPSN